MRGKSGLREALKKCQISLEEVGIEVRAQIAAFKQLTGVPPTYLDGHQHVHVLPGIAAVVARVAAREGVKFVRIPDELPTHFEGHVSTDRSAFYRTVTSQASDARQVMADEGLVGADSFLGLGLMGADLTHERLRRRLRALLQDAQAYASCPSKGYPSGGPRARLHAWDGAYVAEYMCHVGKPSAQGDDFSKSPDRLQELRLLTAHDMHEWLACNCIELSSYQRLTGSAEGLHTPPSNNRIPAKVKQDVEDEIADDDDGPRGLADGEGTQGLCSLVLPIQHRCSELSEEEGHRQVHRRAKSAHDAEVEVGVRGAGGHSSAKLLILSSMTAATGNATTALRLAGLVRQHGWQVECVDVGEVDGPDALRRLADRLGVTAVLGVHAFRAGRLLLQSKHDLPYAIVLGGTDVNVRLLSSVCTWRGTARRRAKGGCMRARM